MKYYKLAILTLAIVLAGLAVSPVLMAMTWAADEAGSATMKIAPEPTPEPTPAPTPAVQTLPDLLKQRSTADQNIGAILRAMKDLEQQYAAAQDALRREQAKIAKIDAAIAERCEAKEAAQ